MHHHTIVLAILGLLLVGVVLVFRTRAADATDGHLCAQEYASARSAAESLLVDARPPQRQLGRGEFPTSRSTCGELRQLGQVR